MPKDPRQSTDKLVQAGAEALPDQAGNVSAVASCNRDNLAQACGSCCVNAWKIPLRPGVCNKSNKLPAFVFGQKLPELLVSEHLVKMQPS